MGQFAGRGIVADSALYKSGNLTVTSQLRTNDVLEHLVPSRINRKPLIACLHITFPEPSITFSEPAVTVSEGEITAVVALVGINCTWALFVDQPTVESLRRGFWDATPLWTTRVAGFQWL